MPATVTFQAQNPKKSGDKRTYIDAEGKKRLAGWANCTAFVAAMGAEFDSGVRLTGTQVRRESSEPVPDRDSPGLNLPQVARVLRTHGVRLRVQCPIDFEDLDELRRAGHAIALQLSYAPIQHTEFSGDLGFDGGHIVLWLPSGDVYDPLADGRLQRSGLRVAKAPVRIPVPLLRQSAGRLILDRETGRTVGVGKAYAGVFSTRHPVRAKGSSEPVEVTFGSAPIRARLYEVVVGTALVRSRPGGVPAHGTVIDRKRREDLVRVVAITRRGQRVAGSRKWYLVNRGGTRFMHSSVLRRVAGGAQP